MTKEDFYKIRKRLYRQAVDRTYYCLGCDHELNVKHTEGCYVEVFEKECFPYVKEILV